MGANIIKEYFMAYSFVYNDTEASYLYVILLDQLEDFKKMEVRQIQLKFEYIWEVLFAYYGIKKTLFGGIQTCKPYLAEKHSVLIDKVGKIKSDLHILLRKKGIVARFFKEVLSNEKDGSNYDDCDLSFCEKFTENKWQELSDFFITDVRTITKTKTELEEDFKKLFYKV